MKSLNNITDKDIKKLIKLHYKNQMEPIFPDYELTQIRIVDKSFGRYSGIVYTKELAPEVCSVALDSKVYLNEVLLLQEMGYNLKELIK